MEAVNAKTLSATLATLTPAALEVQSNMHDAITGYIDSRNVAKEFTTLQKAFGAILAQYADAHPELDKLKTGRLSLTIIRGKDTKKKVFNEELFAQEHEDLYEQYCEEVLVKGKATCVR